VDRGYDELMGARPMARIIQEYIKKPLSDELLFGKLRTGGHVRVIVRDDEEGRKAIGFEYLEGPITPRPEKVPVKKKRRAGPRKPKAKKPGGGEGGGGTPPKPGSPVPKVPLVRA
jgi:ATP-dependent Clp protease ATP-binding subunit ClpA